MHSLLRNETAVIIVAITFDWFPCLIFRIEIDHHGLYFSRVWSMAKIKSQIN